MRRSNVIAVLGLILGIGIFADGVYDFTSFSRINSYILRQHDQVDRLGDSAPLEARTVARLSALPNMAFNFISPAQAQQVPAQTIDRGNFRNHQSFSCGQAQRPTVSGATLTSGSCDFRGQISAPTSNTVTVTFGTAYQAAPICVVSRSDSSSTGINWTVSTTALTISAGGAATVANWICLGVML